MQFHQEKNSDITIASCFVKPADRYGVMNVDRSGKVVNFLEKGIVNEGLINGGVYILNKKKFSTYFDSLNQLNFSFEELVLSNNDLGIKKYHFLTNGYFLDIGVPADYLKAQTDLFV